MLRAILLTIFGFAFILSGMINPKELAVGDKVENFSLANIDGKLISLDSYENAIGYVVIFTCNNCPYAKAYQKRIAELHNEYAPKGIPVIAINPNDSKEKIKQRSKEKNYPFAYLHDETQEVTRAYGASKTPHVFILNKEKTVMYIGAIDNNYKDAAAADKRYVNDALDAMLASKKIEVTNTRALGCSIKWRNS